MADLVPISKLKPNPTNPRVLHDERFAKLKRSIQDFPDMLNYRSIVAVTDTDGKFMVLGGNMRLRALQELGIKEVPVMLADHWTEEQRRRFIIADNVGFGEWDWDQLANEWDAGELSDWGLDAALPPIDLREMDEQATDGMKITIHCKDQAEYDDLVRRLGKSPSAELVKSLML